MRQSTTGALLSGLVYPGVGQVVLGRKYAGAGFIALATVALLVMAYRIISRVYLAWDEIARSLGQGILEPERFIEMLFKRLGGAWHVEGVCLVVLVFCWVASTAHAYLLGRKLDQQD